MVLAECAAALRLWEAICTIRVSESGSNARNRSQARRGSAALSAPEMSLWLKDGLQTFATRAAAGRANVGKSMTPGAVLTDCNTEEKFNPISTAAI